MPNHELYRVHVHNLNNCTAAVGWLCPVLVLVLLLPDLC